MANNVDKRVVEMQFDNAQFEQGVKTSTESLEKLKKGLDFSGVTGKKGLDLAKTLDMTGTVADVEKTANAFEKFKSHVPDVMKTAGKAMLAFGVTGTAAIGGVTAALGKLTIKGGITRAMNLKQADFMLQGLVKDEKAVKAIMADVNDSVDGTAYSLDQAALVASQFAATGMRGGKDMNNALKAVAGTAAVFGADYQRVGQIFTQVSGQGRLMGNDLLQLSTMGMNAAATLADYFDHTGKKANATEAEIRDMVSKGQIDFQTFANAMNWAFGKQAAKANETFSGALANLKSAFSRIGEKIASPVIDSLRDLFNAIRPLVNALNAQLSPALDIFGQKIGKIGDNVSSFIEKIGGSEKVTNDFLGELDFDVYNELADYLKKVHKGTVEASDDVQKLAKSFKKGDDITAKSIKNLVDKKKISFDTLKKSTDEASKADIARDYLLKRYSTKDEKYTAKIAKYFNEVNKGSVKTSKAIEKTIKDLTKGKEVTSKTVAELIEQEKLTNEIVGEALGKNVWESPLHDWSVFGTFMRGLKNIALNVKGIFDALKGAFTDVFPPITVQTVRNIAEGFNRLTFYSFISQKTLDNLRSTFKGVFTIFKGFGSVLKGVFTIFAPFAKGLVSLAGAALSITGRIGDVIVKLDEIIRKTGIFNGVVKTTAFIVDSVMTVFKGFADTIADIFSVFSEGSFSKHMESFANIGDKIADSFSKIGDSLTGKFPQLGSILDNIAEGFRNFGKSIKEAFRVADFSFLTDLASAGGISAIFISIKSFIDSLSGAFDGSVGMLTSIKEVLDGLKETFVAYQNTLKAQVLLKIAQAIAILAASVIALSFVNPKRLIPAVAAIEVLLFGMFKMMDGLSEIGGEGLKGVGKIIKLSSLFITVAISVGILAAAVFALSKLKPGQVVVGLAAVAVACEILVKVAERLSSDERKTIKGAKSLIIFSAAILVLAKAVEALGTLKLSELAKGLGSVIVLLGSLAGFMAVLTKKGAARLDKSAASILVLAGSLYVMAQAVRALSGLSVVELGKGLGSVIVLLGSLALFSKVFSKKGSIKFKAVLAELAVLAGSIYILVEAVKAMASLELNEIGRGLLGLASGVAILVTALGVMSSIKGGGKAAASMVILVIAIQGLARAMKSLGGMKMSEIGHSLLALASGLAAMIMALGIMSTMGASGIVAATSLLVMSAALRVLAPAIKELGSMSLKEIGMALLAVAGAFGVLGLAALVLQPVIPAILLLSGAIAAIGLACVAAGAGILMVSMGLAALAAMAPSTIEHLVEVIQNLAKAIPVIFSAIGLGIVELIRVLGENSIALAAVGVDLILALLGAINDRIYDFVNIGLQICVNFINGIANNLPSIIQAGMNLMISFINGMAEGIRNSQEFIFSAVGNLMGAIINFVLSFLQILAEEVPVIGDFLSGGLEKAKQKVDEKLNPEYAKQKAKEFSEGYSSGVDESAEQAGKSGEKLADNAAKGADKSDYFKKAASKAGNVYNTDLGKAAQKAKGIGVKFPENAGKGADRVSAFQSAANKAGDKYNSALKNKARSARTAGSDLATNAKSGMDSVTGFYDVGVDGAQGFVNGASSKDTSAYNAGLSLAGQFKQAIIDKLDSHSPSRETYKLGYFGLIGFVNAVNDNLKLARNSGVGIANALLSGLKDTSREISASVDGVDLIPNQPVIKPVVDLSGVRAASDDINSMFLNTNAIKATASIGNVASSNIDANFKMEALFRKLGDKIDALSESNNNLDPEEIYNAIFMGASNAQPSVRLNERELGRGLQDMGVAFR